MTRYEISTENSFAHPVRNLSRCAPWRFQAEIRHKVIKLAFKMCRCSRQFEEWACLPLISGIMFICSAHSSSSRPQRHKYTINGERKMQSNTSPQCNIIQFSIDGVVLALNSNENLNCHPADRASQESKLDGTFLQ